MKLKLAIICGILIWIISSVFTEVFNPIFNSNLPHVNIIVPIITIIVTGFFGIIYIRNIETNEVVEGILVGIIFVIIDSVILFPVVFRRIGFRFDRDRRDHEEHHHKNDGFPHLYLISAHVSPSPGLRYSIHIATIQQSRDRITKQSKSRGA